MRDNPYSAEQGIFQSIFPLEERLLKAAEKVVEKKEAIFYKVSIRTQNADGDIP